MKYRMVYPPPGISCSRQEGRGRPDILVKLKDALLNDVSTGMSGTRGVCQPVQPDRTRLFTGVPLVGSGSAWH